jgi:hypothetical protein
MKIVTSPYRAKKGEVVWFESELYKVHRIISKTEFEIKKLNKFQYLIYRLRIKLTLTYQSVKDKIMCWIGDK